MDSQPNNARFVVKFNNGYWKAFDVVQFRDDALHYTRAMAEEFCERANRSTRPNNQRRNRA